VEFKPNIEPMDPEIRRQLAASGVLRAGINLSNFLLVSSRTSAGEPAGVSPDMARAIADHLALELEYVTYPSPGKLADAARRDEWDIALIGAEPQRAEVISFTPAYAEIEATYLAPAGSRLHTVADVDAPGVRIAVTDRTAYGLWLDRNIHQAHLIRSGTFDESLRAFLEQRLEALAGLRPRLISDVATIPGCSHPRRPLYDGAAGDRDSTCEGRRPPLPGGVRPRCAYEWVRC
jgi:polar amino acid transport system substrate-binding protein